MFTDADRPQPRCRSISRQFDTGNASSAQFSRIGQADYFFGDWHGLILPLIERQALFALPGNLVGRADNLGSALHQAVVGECFGGAFFAFAHRIQAVA